MRLFVAILLDDAVKSALRAAQTSLAQRCPDVRWVSPPLLHLTVKFLGETADGHVAAVCDAVTEAIDDVAPFRLTVGGCGCFPRHGPVLIVWAGVAENSGILGACAERIDLAMEKFGFAREQRQFSPHVTLGRVRNDRSNERIRSGVQDCVLGPIDQSVSAVTVMSSVLSPNGATYTTVATLALGGVRGPTQQ